MDMLIDEKAMYNLINEAFMHGQIFHMALDRWIRDHYNIGLVPK